MKKEKIYAEERQLWAPTSSIAVSLRFLVGRTVDGVQWIII